MSYVIYAIMKCLPIGKTGEITSIGIVFIMLTILENEFFRRATGKQELDSLAGDIAVRC